MGIDAAVSWWHEVWSRLDNAYSRSTKMWLGMTNVVFGMFWLALCIGTFRHWGVMTGLTGANSILLSIIYPTLWICLLRERASIVSRLMTCCALWGTLNILW
jgi:hypothetical protein